MCESDRESVCARERERECVCVREREKERASVCVCERERERARACVCVCERERASKGFAKNPSVNMPYTSLGNTIGTLVGSFDTIPESRPGRARYWPMLGAFTT